MMRTLYCVDLLSMKCCRGGLKMSAVKSKVMSLRLDVQELRLHVQGLDLVWVWLYLLLGV